MEPMVTCPGCGTNLKLRATTLRFVKEIRCTKCSQNVPIPPELRLAEIPPQPASSQPVPQPAARPAAPGAPPPHVSPPVTSGIGTVSFVCTGCGKKTSLLKSFAGKKVKCPGCQCINAVPEIVVDKKPDIAAPAHAFPPAQSVAAPAPALASTPAASAPPAPAAPAAAAAAHTVQQPGAAEQELLRYKREVRAFMQEELRQARQRVTDLERRIDAMG